MIDELFSDIPDVDTAFNDIPDISAPTQSKSSSIIDDVFKDIPNIQQEFSVYTPEEVASLKAKGPISFAESALRFTDVKKSIPIVGAISDVAQSVSIMAKVNKLQSGKYENETERQNDLKSVMEYAKRIEEQKIRGFTMGANIFQGAIQMPATMVDFLVTSGMAKGAVMAVTKAVGIGAQAGAKALALKAGQTVATVAIGGALSPQYYVPRVGEQKINDMTALTDKGAVIFDMHKEKPAISVAKAYFGACTQFGTELVGGALLNKALAPVKGLASQGLTKAIGKETADKFVAGVAKLHSKIYNKATEKFLSSASYHGLVEEIGEEYMNKYVNAFFGLEDLTGQDERPLMQRVVEATGDAEEFFTTAGVIATGSLLTAGLGKVVSNNTKLLEQHLEKKGLSQEEIKVVVENTTESEKEAELLNNYDIQTEVIESPEVTKIVDKVIEEIQPQTDTQAQLEATENALEPQGEPQVVGKEIDLSEIPESDRPLYEEALKYDSAEEFVKNKINLYHGTPVDFDEFKLNTKRNTENETNSLGIWFSLDKQSAEQFAQQFEGGLWGTEGAKKDVGGKVKSAFADIGNFKIYEKKIGENVSAEVIEQIKKDIADLEKEKRTIINELDKKQSDLYNKRITGAEYQEFVNKSRDLIKQNEQAIEQKNNELKDIKNRQRTDDPFEVMMDERDEFTLYNRKRNSWRERYILDNKDEANRLFVEKLKKQGYKGILIKDTEYDAGGKGQTISQIVVFDPLDIKTEKQLTDIYNKAQKLKQKTAPVTPKGIESIPESERPLYEEALKYDSAEEFIKAQGEVVYHGTDVDFNKFERQKKAGVQKEETLQPLFFARTKKTAKSFMKKNIIEAVIDKYAKIWDFDGFKNDEDIMFLEFENLLKIKYNYNAEDSYNFAKGILKGNWDAIESKEFQYFLESKNYDGFNVLEDGIKNLGILNPNVIKTKSQLTDIYNKAHEMKKPKASEINEAKKQVDILPPDVDIKTEAKNVGAKRIAPDRIIHQQLTPRDAITKLNEDVSRVRQEWNEAMSSYRGRGTLRIKAKLLEDIQKYAGSKKINEVTEKLNSLGEKEIKEKYIQMVKNDISKGYKYPQEVLSFDKSFEKAVDSRARYEKGLATSFSSDDARIVFDEKNRIVAGMKRQDGKALSQEQKQEIVEGVMQFQKAMGIDLNELAKAERWVFVHLNGKNPFLKKATAGLYRKAKDNVSVSIGGVEMVDEIINGKKVFKKINTTTAHELGHALDGNVGNNFFDNASLVYRLSQNFNPIKLSSRGTKYWKNKGEVTARAIEQYVAVKEGHSSIYSREGYWSKDIFENQIKPAVEDAIEKHFSKYKTKSQLTDIYNKAHEMKKSEEKPQEEPVKAEIVEKTAKVKPVETKAEKKKSKVFQRAIETFNELANVTGQEYDVKNNAEQMAKAEMLFEQNPDIAERIAYGRQKAPEGILSTAVNIYYTQKMLDDKQFDKAEKALRQQSLQQTLRGQEIQIESKRATNLNDPQLFMQDVINKKLDLAGTKLVASKDETIKGEKKSPKRAIAERITQDIKAAETEIEKQQLSNEDFIKILKELSC